MEGRFTPQAILDHTRSQFTGNVVRAFLLTPEAGEASAEQLRTAMLAPPPPAPLARAIGPALRFADLPPIGTPSLPSLREPLGTGLLATTERLEFPNGVRAMIRDSNNEPGRVTVQVRFGAGRSGFAPDEAVYANLGASALVSSGVGGLGPNELDRITAGRKVSFGFTVDEGSFTFTGDTRSEDLADQLYLFAAKLATPRWDVAVVERAKASALLSYDALDGDPMGVLARDLDALLRNGDPRYATPTPEALRAATASDFRRVWQRMLSEGEVEVSVFGDIDPAATVLALGQTFGALPPRTPLDTIADRASPSFPASNPDPLVLRHDGDADQAAALVAWPTGGGSAGIPQARKLEVLAQLISNRLLDGLREEAGSAYTPFASANWPLDLDRGGYLLALVQLAPRDVPTVFTAVDAIVADLAQNGPSVDELARVIEPMRQYIMRAQNSHAFWQNELAGGLSDPYRLGHLPTLATDYVFTSREEVQALAQRYLVGHGGYRVAVLPQGASAP
jgi:zinc protease